MCVSVTSLDELVIGRSLFHHSCNFRSAVLFGSACLAESEEERMHGLRLITSQAICPERWEDAREPNANEMKSTAVLRFVIESGSFKERQGEPKDNKSDIATNRYWAGLIPLVTTQGPPISSTPDLPVPSYFLQS